MTVSRTYDDWLPSMNLALYPAQNVIVRGAIAKVLTRPTLGNLTPGGTIDGFNFRITYGNPHLEPYRATNFDLGIEWYFAPQAILSVAGFVKKVESFPISQAFSRNLRLDRAAARSTAAELAGVHQLRSQPALHGHRATSTAPARR